jgi:DNA-binding NarL/FixJ family response regulator
LFVTPKTVEFQLSRLCQKLHIASRSEIADALGDGGPR